MTPTQPSQAVEREKFEAWFEPAFDDKPVWNEARNCYVEFDCHMAWKGWQARAELARPQAKPSNSDASDARREIGKWLNEETNRPVDRMALAILCDAFDALARPQEVASDLQARCAEIIQWQDTGVLPGTALRDLAERIGDDDGGHSLQRAESKTAREAMELAASRAPEVAAVGPMTSIDDMCAILKRRHINASEYTDCTILYQVTFEQLRAIYDEGRATNRAPEVVRAEPVTQQFYCNKCGYIGRSAVHPGCDYDASQRVPVALPQEPVAWPRKESVNWIYYETPAWGDVEPLYTAPPSTAPAAEQGDAKDARLLTADEILTALVAELNAGVKHTPHEIVQRKFCEVNGIAILASKPTAGKAK